MERKSTFLFALLTLCDIAIASDNCTLGLLSYSKLYTLNGTEIKEKDLGKVYVGEQLQIKEVFFDECGEKITNIDLSTGKLGIVFELVDNVRGGTDYSHNETQQNEVEIKVTLKSNFAGKFKLTSKYFQLKAYYVTFVPGEPGEKSILEVDKTVVSAGEIVTVYIIPYDKYENLIDATAYKNSNSNPYKVNYNYLTSKSNSNVDNFEIVKIVNYQLISYEVNLTEAGIVNISAKIGNYSLNIRTVTVNPAGIDFIKSKIKRCYRNNKEIDVENGTIENNYDTKLTYKIYPNDKYGNKIKFVPEKKFENIKLYLNFNKQRHVFYYFTLKYDKLTEKQYIEFIVDDDKNKIAYKNLVSGKYDLVFTDGSENLLYSINLNNGCSPNSPFRCQFNNKQCVASQTDCDCPEGYYKCDKYFFYCVKREDMCPGYNSYFDECWRIFGNDYFLFYDRKCRNKYTYQAPNQKVCPIGKVLCADLSCKDNYDECTVSDECDLFRCPDQTCVNYSQYCPTTFACENLNDYVCNNNTCVGSELECQESDVDDSTPANNF